MCMPRHSNGSGQLQTELEECRVEILQRSDGTKVPPKLRTTPRNFIFPLVFADSFRQIGLAVYPGFCPRIHEREQSVRDRERMREGTTEERTFTHERKRSPEEERKEFASEKGWQNARS